MEKYRTIDETGRPGNPIHRFGLWLARPYLREVYIYAKEQHAQEVSGEPLERYWMGRMSTVEIALGGRFWSRWRMWLATGYRGRLIDHWRAR